MKCWILATGQGAYNGDRTDRYKVWVTRFDRMALWPGCCAFQYILGMWEWLPFNQLMYLNWDDYRHFKIKCSTEIHVLEITWIPCRKVRTSLKKGCFCDHSTIWFFSNSSTENPLQGVSPWSQATLRKLMWWFVHRWLTMSKPWFGFGPKTKSFVGENRVFWITNRKWLVLTWKNEKINEQIVFYRDLDVCSWVWSWDSYAFFLQNITQSWGIVEDINLPWCSNP